MQRLSGLDAAFLYVEGAGHPMHTLKLLLFERRGAGEPDLRTSVVGRLRARLPELAPLGRRMLSVPFGLHHPLWVEDPGFDLDAHVHRADLPARATPADLEALVASVAAQPLDRGRPLWQMWTIEDLHDGRSALLVKIHHALADGVAIAHLLERLLGEGPLGDASAAPASAQLAATPLPSPAELVAGALWDHARLAVAFPGLVLRTQARLAALAWQGTNGSSVRPPRPVLDTPIASFNGALTPDRSFSMVSFSLDAARRVRAAFGVTLNDVVLAVVGGAVRRYLHARSELPERALVASVPVSSEQHGAAPHLSGNHISSLFASLATDVADPGERLRAIHEVSTAAKRLHGALGAELMGDWAAYAPPALFSWALATWPRRRMRGHLSPAINLIVSNVPGPSTQLSLPGHRLEAIYSACPVLEGIGLNITAWSYQGQIHVGALACRDLVPEPGQITGHFAASLDELLAAAEKVAPGIRERALPAGQHD